MERRKHHHVYVIELTKDVLLEPRFRSSNPGYVEGKSCVYVGIDLRSAGFGVWQA